MSLIHTRQTVLRKDNFSCLFSIILADMMMKAYSDLNLSEKCKTASDTVYQKKYQSLKDRIYDEKNWYEMQQQLSLRIVNLMLIYRDYSI